MRFRSLRVKTCLGVVAALAAGSVYADEDLNKAAQNPNNWAMPA